MTPSVNNLQGEKKFLSSALLMSLAFLRNLGWSSAAPWLGPWHLLTCSVLTSHQGVSSALGPLLPVYLLPLPCSARENHRVPLGLAAWLSFWGYRSHYNTSHRCYRRFSNTIPGTDFSLVSPNHFSYMLPMHIQNSSWAWNSFSLRSLLIPRMCQCHTLDIKCFI